MHLQSHLLGAFLLGTACRNSSQDSEPAVEDHRASPIVGPYVSGLFLELCNPAVFARLAEPLLVFNERVLDEIDPMYEPIEVSTHVSELTDEEQRVFYDGGNGSIDGYLQTNALYFSSELWDIGCVGTYLYSARSASDATLDLYGGDFTVYFQWDEGYENIRVLWTSSRGPETPAGIFFWDNANWGHSSNEDFIPDLHEALGRLAEFVEQPSTSALCPDSEAFYDECE